MSKTTTRTEEISMTTTATTVLTVGDRLPSRDATILSVGWKDWHHDDRHSPDHPMLCTYCDEPVVQVHARHDGVWPDQWDNDGTFVTYAHADGTPQHTTPEGDRIFIGVKADCPECFSTELSYRDTGYGTEATCLACGWSRYTDRGD